jgi:hypothetical protein
MEVAEKKEIVSLSLWERVRVREIVKIRKLNLISPLILVAYGIHASRDISTSMCKTLSQREKGLKQKISSPCSL